jgi:tRNA(Ile)-lysidine synthase
VRRRDPLLGAVERAARRLGLAERSVLVAASGGIDSTLLAHALHALAGRLGLRLALGHVNHGLRGAEADADQAFVASLGEKLGVPVLVRRVAPQRLRAGRPSRARPTLQEAARRLRYAALEEMAREAGAQHVATAHTLDDQAETVLLRLLRGTGPPGLGGIPERSPDGRIVRPLLGVSRREIERFAAERRLSWREDASNRDPAYARARLRRDWLAGLGQAFNPRWLRAVGDLAEAQRRESEWIEARVSEEASRRLAREGDTCSFSCEGIEALPVAVARRLARRVLHEAGAGRDLSRRHLERVLAFAAPGRSGARLELPGGLVLVRWRRRLRFERDARASLHARASASVPRSEPTRGDASREASEAGEGQAGDGC